MLSNEAAIQRNLARCRVYLAAIRSRTVHRLLPVGGRATAAAMLHAALPCRMEELGGAAVDLLQTRRFLPAAVVTRAAFETMVLQEALVVETKAVVATGDFDRFHKAVDALAFGGRGPDWPHKAVNVLTLIAKLEHQPIELRQRYDELSEWCHPNAIGVIASYLELQSSDQPAKVEVGTLNTAGKRPLPILCSILLRVCLARCTTNIVRLDGLLLDPCFMEK